MKWITRRDVKVDRVACPWLLRHFVDPDAEFLFVAESDLLDEKTGRVNGRTAGDINTKYNKGESLCGV